MSAYGLSPRARSDLGQIWDYTAGHWGMDQADRYVRQITDGCADLASGRSVGRDIDHIRPGYFRYAIAAHLVLYRWVDGSRIEVIRVPHRRMDVQQHL